MVEREEEMNRMREHVFGEVDKDKNRQIDLQEFLDSTKGKDFDEEDPWEVRRVNGKGREEGVGRDGERTGGGRGKG